MNKFNIAMVSSEIAPLAKTGGLADVLAALPRQLLIRGHQCCVFLPAYKSVLEKADRIEDLQIGFPVWLGDGQMSARVLKATLGPEELHVYLIDQPQFFYRDALYGDMTGDYPDNCARFTFFNRATLEAIRRLRLPIDIIHCHDWQSGLIPAYLSTKVETLENSPGLGVVTTIHNLAYQGRYWSADFHMTGLPWDIFNAAGVEFYNDLCFLKSGLVFADEVTTVSKHYAKEIQSAAFGCGLEGVLKERTDRLHGIVNGVDYEMWNPRTDTHIAMNYDVQDWQVGKDVCKAAVQQEMGLPVDGNVPLIGLVGRLASQKGWDLVLPLMEKWLADRPAQWVVLGSGDVRFQEWLGHLHRQYPHKLGLRVTFSEPLAHRIEAGSDMFLMPSQYEPCGLNQLYSLRYGTVPIVHAVGGLVDTVQPFRWESWPDEATGFSFDAYNLESLENCLDFAVQVRHESPDVWAELVQNGMKQDWSWDKSAEEYEMVYQSALARKRIAM